MVHIQGCETQSDRSKQESHSGDWSPVHPNMLLIEKLVALDLCRLSYATYA